jgi:hypothetical protein
MRRSDQLSAISGQLARARAGEFCAVGRGVERIFEEKSLQTLESAAALMARS